MEGASGKDMMIYVKFPRNNWMKSDGW